VASLR